MSATEKTLADMAVTIAQRIREHFTVENEPPPPCSGSFSGYVSLIQNLSNLQTALPPRGDFSSSDGTEIYRHEVVERLRTVADELMVHFDLPKNHSGGLAAIPPVNRQAYLSLCWSAMRLRDLESSADDPQSRTPVPDSSRNAPIQVLLDAVDAEVLKLAGDKTLSGEERMIAIVRVDRRYEAKQSTWWAELLGVTDGTVRGYGTWKDIQTGKRNPD
jgi:hypothetical protein